MDNRHRDHFGAHRGFGPPGRRGEGLYSRAAQLARAMGVGGGLTPHHVPAHVPVDISHPFRAPESGGVPAVDPETGGPVSPHRLAAGLVLPQRMTNGLSPALGAAAAQRVETGLVPEHRLANGLVPPQGIPQSLATGLFVHRLMNSAPAPQPIQPILNTFRPNPIQQVLRSFAPQTPAPVAPSPAFHAL